jgi:hypothetical protein
MPGKAEQQQCRIFFRALDALPLNIAGYTGPPTVEFQQAGLECKILYVPPEKEDAPYGAIKLEMRTSTEVSGNVARLFRVLRDFAKQNPPDRSAVKLGIVHGIGNDPHGYSQLPEKITNLVFDAQDRVTQVKTDVIKAFRWRFALAGNQVLSLREPTLEWSMDKLEWYRCPHYQSIRTRVMPVTTFTVERQADIIDAVKTASLPEPFAHEILREAYSVVESSRRSALLLGISAVETRIRAFLMNQPQPTPWFLDQRGAVRTIECLTGLLPLIVTTPPVVIGEDHIPKNVIKHLCQAIKCRDRISHGKAHSLTEAELSGYLRVAQDILWFIDYFDGHPWAGQHLSISATHGLEYMTTGNPAWPS